MMLHFIFLFGFPVQPLDVKCVKHNKFGLTLKKNHFKTYSVDIWLAICNQYNYLQFNMWIPTKLTI